MERQVWLAERRAALVDVYDAEAATYGDGPQPWDVQRAWVARVLGLIPPGGVVLDAPCGTGKYFAMLAAAGHRVAGADQSAGMLARARARGIAFSLERISLQDLSYAGRFDAILPIEAMQHIPPEDWLGVLANADFRTGTSTLGSSEFEAELASVPPGDGGVGGQVGSAEDG
jgi:2-polyprenyl-3-methyl-5-hydroxy-6-metoxy-1,4-benzoquinol methylase